MNTLLIMAMFIPPLRADYRCDLNVEVHNICTMPYLKWYVNPIDMTNLRLA